MATPQTFVATTIGRVAIPKLADTLVKTGADKFVKQYGQKAFEAILGTSIGARAYSKTEEYITEYLNHIDTGGDEESFVPKGSMPTATRSEQMDAVMAVPDTTPFSGDLKVPGVIAPDATEMEKEAQKIRDMTMPVGLPSEPPIKVDTTTGDSEPPKIETTEEFPIEEQLPDTLSTPIEDNSKPIIYYNEKVGKKMLTKESTDYRLQHKPRGPDDEYPVRLDDLTQTTTGESAGYPKDFYSEKGKRIYAPGQSFEGDEFGIANNESYSIINSVRGNPDAEVTIYRAVPNEKNITKINPGDFVTLSKRYADLHGAGGYGRDGTDSGKVLELKVKVKDVYWDQNDVNEFGYFPEKNKDDENTQTEELVRGIGDNNPPSAIEEEPTVSKTTPKEYKGEIIETTSLNENLKEAIAKYAGTPEDIAKSLKMPQSHKRKIYIQLEEYLNENYPSKLSEKEQEVESDALFYIANSVYDIYTYRGEGGMPRDTLMVQDDIGFPLATAEIERYPKGKLNYYPRRKKGNKYVKTDPAIYIETIGSLNRDATSKILDQVEKIAEIEEVRYIVAEDLTSEAAAKALEKRGFVPAKKGFFEGDIINEADWRGGKKNVKQKNMVLDLGEKYRTTEEEIQKEFDKEQSDIDNQTKKLLNK